MKNKFLSSLKRANQKALSFFVPRKENLKVGNKFVTDRRVVALIPAYKSKAITYELVSSLLIWHPEMEIVLVDDSTPKYGRGFSTINKLKKLAGKSKNLTYLRTPVNKLKAGALNYGFEYISKLTQKPQVVVTLDDDIKLNKETIPTMIKALYSEVSMGAVCSLTKVRNKNKSFLTRLQAMEYHNFNIVKVSDNGFLKGPLVMPGALTVFRYAALREVEGFTTGHLIEDYDVTAKLKRAGWKVGISKDAEVWTDVPEELGSLWKQRVRWTLGGLTVIKDFWKNTEAIFQDVFGHIVFISLFIFIVFSFVFACDCGDNPTLVLFLVVMSMVNILAANAFNILTFFSYGERDKTDWLIKLSFIPEFIYSNFLTLILLGSYAYFLYNEVVGKVFARFRLFQRAYNTGLSVFSKAGYSYTWGTRQV